jgi:hypothetical protein
MKSTKLFVGAGLALAVGVVAIGASITASAASNGQGPAAGGSAMSITANGDDAVMCSVDVADLTALPVGQGVQVFATVGAAATDASLTSGQSVISGTAAQVDAATSGVVISGDATLLSELPEVAVQIDAGQLGDGEVFVVSVDANGQFSTNNSNVTVREGSVDECAAMMPGSALPAAPPPTAVPAGDKPAED